MKRHFMLFLLLISSVCFSINAYAQLELTENNSGNDLAQELLGSGVQISNIVLNCPDGASGTFDGTYTNLGIDQGIVLSSGAIDVLDSPNNQGGATGNLNGSFPGDPDLDEISGGNTNDACVLEFDLVPYGDTLRFNYVFGSEEYLEFVGSFNDAFALLISGTNPGGGTYSNTNIALVPNTNTPVTINNVNDFVNSEYYVNNGTGANPGPNSTVQLDGFTVLLEAKAAVVPCETYHLKLAVADALDNVLDSAVFIEAGSLGVPLVSVSATTTFTSVEGFDNIVEGCVDAIITFQREGDLSSDLAINYSLGGTAVEGEDYETLPAQIVIPAGETEYTIQIPFYNDGVDEDTETIVISVSNQIACADSSIVESVYLEIIDQEPLVVSGDVTIAPGESTILQAYGGGFNYNWSPNIGLSSNTVPNPIASPVQTTTYTVSSSLGNCQYQQSVTVFVEQIDTCVTAIGTLSASPPEICAGESIFASVNSQNLDENDVLIFVAHNNPQGNMQAADFEIYASNTSGEFSAQEIPTNTTVYITAIAGDSDGNGGVDMNDECAVMSNTVAVMIREQSAGVLSTDMEIVCAASAVTASATETLVPEGSMLVYVLHNNEYGNVYAEDFLMYEINQSGVFANGDFPQNETLYISAMVAQMNDVENINLGDLCLSISNTHPVVFLTPISINVSFDCDGQSGISVATYSLSGGYPAFDNSAFYTVQGDYQSNDVENPDMNGIAAGEPFTVTYLDGQMYQIYVNDEYACDAQISGDIVCVKCLSSAGILSNIDQVVCGSDYLHVETNGANFQEGDALVYVIHTENSENLGQIIGMSATGDFSFEYLDVELRAYNTQYYVSAIVGPSDGGGGVLMGQSCVDIENGGGVIFDAPITLETTLTCITDQEAYSAAFTVSGGQSLAGGAAYYMSINGEEVTMDGNFYYIPSVSTAEVLAVTLTDALGCSISETTTEISCEGPTALDLLQFDGVVLETKNTLYWQTANEYNHDYFLLQKSTDGLSFETIARVEAASKSSSSTVLNYTYDDVNVVANSSAYYRLKMIDVEGKADYSSVINLQRTQNAGSIVIDIAPNPATTHLFVHANTSEKIFNLSIFNAQGKLMMQKSFTQNTTVNIEELPAGIYYVAINGTQSQIVQKIIKY
ncbi:MAG: choice-of-anchor L domain-containing protein [Chitinophagales bacterium]|nr:choice-of-anchor L domain-containing protein [Bacteroidota bacterium]